MKMEITNECNLELMKRYQDDFFDLAIVDPPYGHGNNLIVKGNTRSKIATAGQFKSFDNSKSPDPEYFEELRRVSKNQIIWGANHFASKFKSSSSAWIVWDKHTTGDFADCELAFSSFGTACRKFDYMWNGMHQGKAGGNVKLNEKRIHPTQKPVKLYEWLLLNYSKKGDKILDTHLGSGSIALACHNLKFDLTACELDKDYYSDAMKRLKIHQQQQTLF